MLTLPGNKRLCSIFQTKETDVTLPKADDERILVMMPTGRKATLICHVLDESGLICLHCPTSESFFAALTEGVGALLIEVEALSLPVMQNLARFIAQQPAWSDLALVLLGKRDQHFPESWLRQQLGAEVSITQIEHPVQPSTLRTLCQSLIQARRRQYQVRDLLAKLVSQTAALQQEVDQRLAVEAEQERLLAELAQERAQLRDLTDTLEEKVRAGTQQARMLAAQLSLAEHGERQRVARILHDHIQQMLYAAQFQAQLLDMKLPTGDEADLHKYLGEMQRLLDETVQSVRTLSVDLSPPVLEREGLLAALRWLGGQMQDRFGLTVTLESNGDCRIMNQYILVVIFQTVREILFNVVKHAHVHQAWIGLHCTDDLLTVTIKDEGVGFDVACALTRGQTATGLGLTGIGKRIDLFEGQLAIASAPGAGTTVSVTLPLT